MLTGEQEPLSQNWDLPEAPKVWRTDSVVERERFSYYREAVCEAFMDLAPELKERDGFYAEIESVPLGDGAINRVDSSPHDVICSSHEVSRAPRECYYLNLQLAGQCVITQGDNDIHLKTGQVGIFSSSKPFRIELISGRASDVASFWVPRERMDQVTLTEDRFDGVHLSNYSSLGQLLVTTMQTALAGRKTLNHDERKVLFETILNLVPLTAGQHTSDDDASGNAIASATQLSLLRYIDRALDDPELSVSKVASSFRISKRYLHKLLEPLGTSFSKYVLGKRLELVSLDLCCNQLRQHKISTIVYRRGFSDLSYFNKTFKARYGMTPTEFRRRAFE